ncbi:MAG: hypothetical protein CL681_10800 [Blastopirellula sp.]|nr:hypothetical protein [Blastopirellula sp.]
MNPSSSNPFPGLRPFTSEEDYLFFGREDQTNELLQLLREHRFIAVVGTSGSGKSSLVRAGLIPSLFGGTMVTVGSRWEVGVFRPGGDPVKNLAQALIDCDLYDAEDTESLPRVLATLRRSRQGLSEAVRQSDLEPGHNLLIVVDQFEELFRFQHESDAQKEEAAAFVQLLLHAASEAKAPVYITITMRSDYLGECAQIPGLAEAVNHGEYLIPRLTRDQRRTAIERPVAVGGGQISQLLINQLLNEVGDEVDQLPVLQHALMRVWDCWSEDHQDEEPLDLRHYKQVGGLTQALSQHADEVYAELPNDRSRLLCERIFKALTERGEDERGIRRPTQMQSLCEIVGGTTAEVMQVLDAYREVGRTFIMPLAGTPIDAETVIDISHESLMRVWRRLNEWVDEESQSARIYRRLADTAVLFHDNRAGHYRDPDLQIALAWRESDQPTDAWGSRYHPEFEAAIKFLEESEAVAHAEEIAREKQRQKELEQARQLAIAQVKAKRRSQLITIVALVAAAVVSWLWNDANRSRRAAEHARDEAEAAAKREEQAKLAETRQRNIAEKASRKATLGLYAATIREADKAIVDLHDYPSARSYLDRWSNATTVDGSKQAPLLRDWEWYYLRGEADQSHPQIPSETLDFGALVNFCGNWSPDGNYLALTGMHGQIVIWEKESRQVVQILKRERQSFVPRIEWSPDSTRVAVDNWDQEVNIYDLRSGLLQFTIPHSGGLTNTALSWNPQHELIAYSVGGGEVGIYDTSACQLIDLIPANSPILAIEWSPDGKRLGFTTSNDGVTLLDYPAKTEVVQVEGQTSQRFRWTPDGKEILVQTDGGSALYLANSTTGELVKKLGDINCGFIWGMSMHPHNRWVAVAGPAGLIGVFDYENEDLVYDFRDYPTSAVGVDWHPDGELLFGAGFLTGTARLYDFSRRKDNLYTGPNVQGRDASRANGDWLADGKHLSLTNGKQGGLDVLDVSTNQVVETITVPLASPIVAHAWSPNYEFLALSDNSGVIIVSATDPSTILARTELKLATTLLWSADSQYLAFAGGRRDYTVEDEPDNTWGVFRVMDQGELEFLALPGADSRVTCISWHPEQAILASGSRQDTSHGGSVVVWNVAQQAPIKVIPNENTQVRSLAFDRSGERLAVAFRQIQDALGLEATGDVKVFSWRDASEILSLRAQSSDINSMCWSLTDKRLITGGRDGGVRIWRDDGTELLSFKPFSTPVSDVFWNSNGSSLFALGVNQKLAQWSLQTPKTPYSLAGCPELLESVFHHQGSDDDSKLTYARMLTASRRYTDAADAFAELPTANTGFTPSYPTLLWGLTEESACQVDAAMLDSMGQLQADALTQRVKALTLPHELKSSGTTEDQESPWVRIGAHGQRHHLATLIENKQRSLRFVYTRIYAPRETKTTLFLAGRDYLFAWKDQELILSDQTPGDAPDGQNTILVDLHAGWNDFVFAIYATDANHALYANFEQKLAAVQIDNFSTTAPLSADLLEAFHSEAFTRFRAGESLRYQLTHRNGDWSAATAMLEQLDKPKAENRASVLRERATLAFASGNPQEAIPHAQAAHALQPNTKSAQLLGKVIAFSNCQRLLGLDNSWESLIPSTQNLEDNVPDLLSGTTEKPQRWRAWNRGAMTFGFGTHGFTQLRIGQLPRQATVSVLRTSFSVEEDVQHLLLTGNIGEAFVVYIDGQEVCRRWLTGDDTFNSLADQSNWGNLLQTYRIVIPSSLAAGEHQLAVSLHPNVRAGATDIRKIELWGIPTAAAQVPDNMDAPTEYAFHLWNALLHGTSDHARMNQLIADGKITPHFIKDNNLLMYQLLEKHRDLNDSTRQATLNGLLRSLFTGDGRARRIVLHGALRLKQPAALNQLFETWVESNPQDAQLMATQIVYAAQHTPEQTEAIRQKIIKRCEDVSLRMDPSWLSLALCADDPSPEALQLSETLLAAVNTRVGGPRNPTNTKIAESLLALRTGKANDETVNELNTLLASTGDNSYQAYLVHALITAIAKAVNNQEWEATHRQKAKTAFTKLNEPNTTSEEDPEMDKWLLREIGSIILKKTQDQQTAQSPTK